MDEDPIRGTSLADKEREVYEEKINSLIEEVYILRQFVTILNEKNDLYAKKAR